MKHPIEVFDEWAVIGKDKGMETSHSASVSEILDFAIGQIEKNNAEFNFLDFGCGNGWVADQLSKNNNCSFSMGIDGAKTMIMNAEKRKSEAVFLLKDLNNFKLNHKFDLIFSMEVLYYLENPSSVIKKIHGMLNPNGRFIMGIDHYFENEESHDWQEKVGTRMHMFRESEWIDFFTKSDFKNIHSWRANSNDWAGTLVITGTN
jgi:2-polyprenyl-3-methyl-5-hydroxy-6-metoxy-1,4-benzoquinol methylase